MNREISFNDRWWSKRWGSVFDDMPKDSRWRRGRVYARTGRVERISIHTGMVIASVKGHQAQPYQVTIKWTTFTAMNGEHIIDMLLERPVLIAKLLAGDMPHELEEILSAIHLSWFPKSAKDLQSNCSCPDSANPCKHIAAVYFALEQSFHKDPLLLLTLRGLSKPEILSRLHRHWMKSDEPSVEAWEESTFWSAASDLQVIPIHLSQTDGSPRTLPMVWGPPHFMEGLNQKGTREMVSLFADILQHASQRATSFISEEE